MNIAFYTPLKPTDSTVPSGDRRMARALISALEGVGYRVETASAFVGRDALGDPHRQARLEHVGGRLADRLVRRYRSRPADERPGLWFTYHLYYKAPDWIGPRVSEALDIPYVVAEASHAPKRAGGPWDRGHRAASAAIQRADRLFNLNPASEPCVRALLDTSERMVPLLPFLDPAPYEALDRAVARAETAAAFGLDRERPWLITVAMMRDGAKLASFVMLGAALARLKDSPFHLLVVGDGSARKEVEQALDGANPVFLGERGEDVIARLLGAADLFVWPAVGEAYGMALLEAQASGLAVVAGDGGASVIVRDGRTGLLTAPGDPGAFAEAVRRLLADPAERAAMGAAARATVAREHGIQAASRVLARALRELRP